MNRTVTVVYVLGTARSGSTLLTRLVAEAGGDAVFAAGETQLLWQELDDRGCGCGRPALRCPVWSEVLARTERDGVPSSGVAALMAEATPLRRLPHHLRRHASRDGLPDATRRYADHLGRTYRHIADVTGTRVVVDSSKSVSEAALLRQVPGVRPVVVLIVRDPRAVVYSWHRALRSGARGTPPHPSWSLALRWVVKNAASEAVLRRYPGGAYQVRYEDLVRTPAPHVAAILRLAGEPAPAARPAGGGLPRGARHIVGGNRLRRTAAPVHVAEDDEWRDRLARGVATEVAGLTYPWRRRYDYGGRSAR